MSFNFHFKFWICTVRTVTWRNFVTLYFQEIHLFRSVVRKINWTFHKYFFTIDFVNYDMKNINMQCGHFFTRRRWSYHHHKNQLKRDDLWSHYSDLQICDCNFACLPLNFDIWIQEKWIKVAWFIKTLTHEATINCVCFLPWCNMGALLNGSGFTLGTWQFKTKK